MPTDILVKLGPPVIIGIIVIIAIVSVIVALFSKNTKGHESTGEVIAYEDNPNNLSIKYPRVSFLDLDTMEDVNGLANAVKFNRLPQIGSRVEITYKKKKFLGSTNYIVNIIQPKRR